MVPRVLTLLVDISVAVPVDTNENIVIKVHRDLYLKIIDKRFQVKQINGFKNLKISILSLISYKDNAHNKY